MPSAIASAARCSPSPSPTWRRGTSISSRRRPSSPPRSISPMPATSRSSSTRGADPDASRSAWPRPAISRQADGHAFNMLRSNDLIWSYFVNNYMKGKQPMPFDLLYWNADSPRMPAGEPLLLPAPLLPAERPVQGRMVVAGETMDLKKVKVPVYNLAAARTTSRRRSVFLGSQSFRWPGRLCHGGVGHTSPAWSIRRRRKIPVMDRQPPRGRLRGLGGQGRGASRLLVAALARMDPQP